MERPTHRMVSKLDEKGDYVSERVDLTEAEADAIMAEWAVEAAKPKPTVRDLAEQRLDKDPLLMALVGELAVARGIDESAIRKAVLDRTLS